MKNHDPFLKESDPCSFASIRSSSSSQPKDLSFIQNPPPVVGANYWEYAHGKKLAWNEFGDPEGFPVFYYHGWPSSRLQARLAHHLAKNRGLRLISMDRPGIGKSTFIPNRKLEDWPALMSGFADHLGLEKFGQIGVSGGGPYVLACAAMIPDRITSSAVLAGMVPLSLTDLGRAGLHPIYRMLIPLRKLPAIFFTLGFRLAALACRRKPDQFPLTILLRSLAEEDRVIMLHSEEIWEVLTKSFIEGVCEPPSAKGVMADSEIYLRNPAFKVENIVHPIHYWHGGDDKNIPAALVKDLTSKMPKSKLHIEESLGHFSLAVHCSGKALDVLVVPST